MKIPENSRPVEGYEISYAVLPEGEVYSLPRTVSTPNGGARRFGGNTLAKVEINGYLYVNLSKPGGARQHLLHRLVAKAFIPNPFDLPQVNHIDGNKLNNRVENLEWVTAQGNIDHAIATSLRSDVGVANNNATLDEIAVTCIFNTHRSGWFTYVQLAKMFGVNPPCIYKICTGRSWKHLRLGH